MNASATSIRKHSRRWVTPAAQFLLERFVMIAVSGAVTYAGYRMFLL